MGHKGNVCQFAIAQVKLSDACEQIQGDKRVVARASSFSDSARDLVIGQFDCRLSDKSRDGTAKQKQGNKEKR